jgi:hypothetical protein
MRYGLRIDGDPAPETTTNMMPARDLNIPGAADETRPRVEPRRLAGPPAPQYATISTLDGRFMTGGLALISVAGAMWRATLSQLDRPGQVATMYFASGIREVLLRLEDGRSARARITGTTFIATAERICELAGVEHLA